MPFFEVIMKGYKVFYVEADDEDSALSHDVVADESNSFMWGEIDWEYDSTTVHTKYETSEMNDEAIEQMKRHSMPVFDKEGKNLTTNH